jgi:hypothetical protein
MTYYIHSGDNYSILPGSSIDPITSLPSETFVLKFNPFTGFYLEQTQKFTLPSKVYGKTKFHAERILNTFRDRGTNTGVLMMGEKGSGKSLLSKQICVNSGYPSIIINDCHTGDQFNSFLASIDQPCIVFFDEFEKVYDREHQKKVLTLLDGTFNSNKLFLLTSNDRWGLDDNMCNRPGRIYYMIEFKGLDDDFIIEYCNDRLNDKSFTPKILGISKSFEVFNFDLLSAFVEEVNRYGEEPKELMELLNAKPRFGADLDYQAYVKVGNFKSKPFRIGYSNVYDEVLHLDICVNYFEDHIDQYDLNNISECEDYDRIVSLIKSGVIRFGEQNNKHNRNSLVFHSFDDLEIVHADSDNTNSVKSGRQSISNRIEIHLTPDMVMTDHTTGEIVYEVVKDLEVRMKKKRSANSHHMAY